MMMPIIKLNLRDQLKVGGTYLAVDREIVDMNDAGKNVSEHYTQGDLEQRILSALEEAEKEHYSLPVDDLAPVDKFHVRGRTRPRSSQNSRRSSRQVLLDVGCGLGGTSRYLANTFACNAVGVDLTTEYCHVAEKLSAFGASYDASLEAPGPGAGRGCGIV